MCHRQRVDAGAGVAQPPAPAWRSVVPVGGHANYSEAPSGLRKGCQELRWSGRSVEPRKCLAPDADTRARFPCHGDGLPQNRRADGRIRAVEGGRGCAGSAHALSGSWRIKRLEQISESALTCTEILERLQRPSTATRKCHAADSLAGSANDRRSDVCSSNHSTTVARQTRTGCSRPRLRRTASRSRHSSSGRSTLCPRQEPARAPGP
jgi:hypothetical protein